MCRATVLLFSGYLLLIVRLTHPGFYYVCKLDIFLYSSPIPTYSTKHNCGEVLQLFLPYSKCVESHWKLTSLCIWMLGIKSKIFVIILCISHCNPFISNSLFAIWSLFCVLPPWPVIYPEAQRWRFCKKIREPPFLAWFVPNLGFIFRAEKRIAQLFAHP